MTQTHHDAVDALVDTTVAAMGGQVDSGPRTRHRQPPSRIKIYFLIRRDVKPGEAATYVAHTLTNLILPDPQVLPLYDRWYTGGTKKVLLSGHNETVTAEIVMKAAKAGINVTYAGSTEKVVALGPVPEDKMLKILQQYPETRPYR